MADHPDVYIICPHCGKEVILGQSGTVVQFKKK